MTEAEWFAATSPKPMLRFLLGTNYPRVQAVEAFPDCIASDRKLRLFACACYYRIRHLLPDLRAQAAVEVAERVADGILPVEELERAEARIREPIDALEDGWRASRGAERRSLLPTHAALCLGLVILWREAQKAAYYAASNAHLHFAELVTPGATSSFASQRAEERRQTDLLREIFGSPFRPVQADPAWRTSTVVLLARGIYEERAFDRFPILADALMDAGCENAEILNHLRSDGPHCRGCWALDLVLGKS